MALEVGRLKGGSSQNWLPHVNARLGKMVVREGSPP
jgi:hypothetical protein